MLDVNPEIVCHLIELAREFQGADFLLEGLQAHGYSCDR